MEKREELQEQADKLKRIRAGLGLSRKAFSEYIGIPLRNLEEWEAGRRKMPEYLLRMLIYYVKMNQYLQYLLMLKYHSIPSQISHVQVRHI